MASYFSTTGSSFTLTNGWGVSGVVSLGDVVYQVGGTDKTIARADADNAAARPPIGVVSGVAGVTVSLAMPGQVCVGFSGLTPGQVYWLSTTPGQLTSTKPATNAYPIGIAVTPRTLFLTSLSGDVADSGSGNGTVNSIAITSSDLTVGGSPVIGAGSIDLALPTVPVSLGGTGLSTAGEAGAMLYASSTSAYVWQNVNHSFRNRITNPVMTLDQRNDGAPVTTDGAYPVDRFVVNISNPGVTFAAQQSSTAPTYIPKSLQTTVSVGSSSGAFFLARLFQRIEGSTVYDLAFGTSSAKTITLSFWVNSTLPGTYCIAIGNGASNRSYVAEYTISAASTWEKKSVTIPGDTAGTWAKDNTTGMIAYFDIGSGTGSQTTAGSWQAGLFSATASQADLVGTGGTFYLTGVQLEAGTVATPLEWREPDTEQELCGRYFYKMRSLTGNNVGFGRGVVVTTSRADVYFAYPQAMRTSPVIAASNTAVFDVSAKAATITAYQTGSTSARIQLNVAAATLTATYAAVWTGNGASAFVTLDAELT